MPSLAGLRGAGDSVITHDSAGPVKPLQLHHVTAAARLDDDAPRFLMHEHLGTRVPTAQPRDLAHLSRLELVCHEDHAATAW